MLNTYKVYKTNGEGMLCELPDNLMRKLNLGQNRLIVLNFGSLSVKVKAISSKLLNVAEFHIGFSKGVLNALKIPQDSFMSIKSLGPGEFRIGPVIGMLTYSRVIAKQNFTEVTKYTKIIRRYAGYAQEMKGCGLFYLFAPDDIRTRKKTIAGYCYNSERRVWEAGEFAYPDVVMDRIYPNNWEAHRKLEHVIGPNKIFNKKTMINKLDFFTTLSSDPVLRNHVPKTQLFNQESDLKQYLKKYRGVFLKPLNGMKGKGIVYVKTHKAGFLCKYMRGREMAAKKVAHINQLAIFLRKVVSRETPYIIQGAVQRMEYRQGPFNFRVMVTKNGLGNWHVRAVFAKLAPPGKFLTNRSLGADYILLNDLFQGIKGQLSGTKKEFLNLLNGLALRTAARLDNEFGPLGKLGLDIVMDTTGKPWLIEANGNPGQICPKVLSEFPAWSSQVYADPVAYAVHLSGFSNL